MRVSAEEGERGTEVWETCGGRARGAIAVGCDCGLGVLEVRELSVVEDGLVGEWLGRFPGGFRGDWSSHSALGTFKVFRPDFVVSVAGVGA